MPRGDRKLARGDGGGAITWDVKGAVPGGRSTGETRRGWAFWADLKGAGRRDFTPPTHIPGNRDSDSEDARERAKVSPQARFAPIHGRGYRKLRPDSSATGAGGRTAGSEGAPATGEDRCRGDPGGVGGGDGGGLRCGREDPADGAPRRRGRGPDSGGQPRGRRGLPATGVDRAPAAGPVRRGTSAIGVGPAPVMRPPGAGASRRSGGPTPGSSPPVRGDASAIGQIRLRWSGPRPRGSASVGTAFGCPLPLGHP